MSAKGAEVKLKNMKKLFIIFVILIGIGLSANAQNNPRNTLASSQPSDVSALAGISSVRVITVNDVKYLEVAVALKQGSREAVRSRKSTSCTVYAAFADAKKHLKETRQTRYLAHNLPDGNTFRFEFTSEESAKLFENIKLFPTDFRVVAY